MPTAAPTATPEPTPLPDDIHIYENAEVRALYNSDRTEKIGEYSIIRVRSDDITLARLNDWYFNYFAQNSFKWCMILYTDRDDNSGVYASSYIETDVIFQEDAYGDYTLVGALNGVMYIPTEQERLAEFIPREEEIF